MRLLSSTLYGHHRTVTSTGSVPTKGSDSFGTNLLAAYRLHDNTDITRADVRDPLPWIDGIDQIYHLACPASPVHFETQPIDILQTCFNGASNVLEYAVKQNARILLASTSGTFMLVSDLI